MRGQNTNNNNSTKITPKSHLKGKSNKTNINNNDESTILLPKSKDGSTAQDTIYLCNFRVSVDGEWLCLKELQDGMQSKVEGAPKVEDPKSIHVANDKCHEKIVEQDWVNYYCRCFVFKSNFTTPYNISRTFSFYMFYQHKNLSLFCCAAPHFTWNSEFSAILVRLPAELAANTNTHTISQFFVNMTDKFGWNCLSPLDVQF